MKPEEFEVYVIPPNFMEGGTLFGGLLKTRNTIEAVILGLAVGVPVLHLPFSLTVRVVILCLTALPLVLLALIGVSGMSLSAFIRLFFCFLHNRRILSRDGTQGGKNGKTLLPSWAQQRKSDCEAEDPPLPKSRSRFSVDLKQRSVTQFKTFLQEEEAVQPLNALADYIPIEKIEHGVIYTRDHRYVKVVEVVPVNFLLRSAREQRSIIYSFISYLKIAPVKVQFKALTKRADINRHLDTVRRELEHEQDPRCRVLQEDYLKLIRQLGSREAITRRFFLVFEYQAFLCDGMLEVDSTAFMDYMEENDLGYIVDYKRYNADVFTGVNCRTAAVFQFHSAALRRLNKVGCQRYEGDYTRLKQKHAERRARRMAG